MKTSNKLSTAELFKIAAELQSDEYKDGLVSGKYTLELLAKAMSKKFGIAVTENNMTALIRDAEIKFVPKRDKSAQANFIYAKLVARLDETERQLSVLLKVVDSLEHRIQQLESTITAPVVLIDRQDLDNQQILERLSGR